MCRIVLKNKYFLIGVFIVLFAGAAFAQYEPLKELTDQTNRVIDKDVKTVVSVSPEKAILINGKTFFPICVWQQPKYLFDYHKYLGINAILAPPQGENKKWYMDAAWEKGLYVFAGYSEEYQDHPAINEIKAQCEKMKSIDPHRLT